MPLPEPQLPVSVPVDDRKHLREQRGREGDLGSLISDAIMYGMEEEGFGSNDQNGPTLPFIYLSPPLPLTFLPLTPLSPSERTLGCLNIIISNSPSMLMPARTHPKCLTCLSQPEQSQYIVSVNKVQSVHSIEIL